ncbi:MAG: hydrolase [Syntrophomonadaceae bacterium]|nr:hydrolase [Syntrophomonadaceae bacterium]MDD3888358.1 hydrolase [Syntrophomonadaceae bacterium]MDD4548864.1 hydrolase [Syntrophomonadaceae bacterium]
MNQYILEGDDCALVIIDLQEKLMKAMKDQDRVYKNTNLLLAIAKEFDIPVIVTEQYPRGLGATVEEIKNHLPEEYFYLDKNSFSALNEEMQAILDKIGRKKIIITGSETHICVFQTARDLVNKGYHVYLVRDAVCSRFDENYENALSLMSSLGAVITTAETVVFDLLKQAGTPAFKAISPLLK